jgi:WD40 repeat protein/tetratricopeptide (TPR) repeat protein
VALLDVNERKLIRVLSDGGGVSRVAFAPTQPLLVFSSGGSVKQLDLVTGDVIVLCEAIGTVRDLAFSPAGNLLAVLSEGNDELFVIATDSRRRIFQQPSPGAHQHFNNARFSPKGDRLWHTYGAFSRGDKTPGLRCINLADGKTLWDVPIGELEGVVVENGRDLGFSAMDVSPSGRVLVTATGYNDPTISVRDAVTGALIKKLRGHTGWIGELRFSRDGRVLASAAADQTVRLWDTAKWQRKFDPFRGHNDEVHTVAFAPDDSFVISGGKDGAVMLWDAHRQPPPGGRLELPDITAAVPVGGASAMCVRKSDGVTVQLDLATFSETPIEGSTPDLAANESSGTAPIRLRGKISASQLSPDGKLRAVSTEDGFIMLYDALTQQEVGTLHGHMQAIFGVAFSPDNQVLASTSGGDEAVRLWDLNTLQPLLTLPGVGTLLKSVHFTADGNVLLVGEPGKAGSFQFWRAPSWDEIAEVERATGIWPSTTDYKVAPVVAAAPMDIESLRKLWERELGMLESESGTSEVQSARDRGRALKLALATLATSLKSKGNLTEAAAVREEELVVERKLSGPEHPATVTLMHTLAILYEEAGRPDEAIRLYAESLPGARKFTGADERKATNAIGRLADLYAKADRWDEALPLLAELCARRPKDSVFAQKVTTLQAWFQKDADHAVTCRRIMELAMGTDDPSVADRAAKAYCLRPSSDPHLLEAALTLARHSVEIGKNRSFLPYYQLALGMAEYRAGNYSATDVALSDAMRGGGGVPIIAGPARFYRAMSLFRQGKDTEARNLFSEAATKMKPMPADERQPLANGAGLDDLIVWLAYKEAKALLQLRTQTAPAKPEGTIPR